MSEPFLGEVKIFSFGYAPRGWAMCNGQILPINQNQALFALFGTTFGGNGQTTFGLPDLRGRTAIHRNTFQLGQTFGEVAHTVTLAEMPAHPHFVASSTQQAGPNGNAPTSTSVLAASSGGNLYGPPNNVQPMNQRAVSTIGGSQPHGNMMPFLTLNFCVALVGIFPSRP